jgi:hypothetical protein
VLFEHRLDRVRIHGAHRGRSRRPGAHRIASPSARNAGVDTAVWTRSKWTTNRARPNTPGAVDSRT